MSHMCTYVWDFAFVANLLHLSPTALDQLKWPRYKLSQMIKGIVLTDHNRPLSYWQNVPLLGMIDQ